MAKPHGPGSGSSVHPSSFSDKTPRLPAHRQDVARGVLASGSRSSRRRRAWSSLAGLGLMLALVPIPEAQAQDLIVRFVDRCNDAANPIVHECLARRPGQTSIRLRESDSISFQIEVVNAQGNPVTPNPPVTVVLDDEIDRQDPSRMIPGEDYTAIPSTTITINTAEHSIQPVSLMDDAIAGEETEFVYLTLRSPTNAVLPADRSQGYSRVAVRVLDNDRFPTLSTVAAATFEEGGSRAFTITVSGNQLKSNAEFNRAQNARGDYTDYDAYLGRMSHIYPSVGYRVFSGPSDTAAGSADYTMVEQGVLSINPFVTGTALMGVITVETLDDDIDENNETFSLQLHSPTFAHLDQTAAVTMTITDAADDDQNDHMLSIGNAAGIEGRRIVFPFRLTPPSGKEVTVNYATSDDSGTGAATAGTDYTAVSGTLTFPAGTGEGVIQVTATADTDDTEGAETFTMTLSSPSNAVISTTTATGTIGSDLPDLPTSVTVTEGGTSSHLISLASAPSGTVTVTIEGGAGRVTVSPSTLIFTTSDWNQQQAVTVRALHDDDSSDQGATLTYTLDGGGYAMAQLPPVGVDISDDDSAELRLSTTSLTVGKGRSRRYTLRLATRPVSEVTVSITGEASGIEVSSPANDSLTFTASNWDTEQTVEVMATASASATVTLTHATSSSGDSNYDALSSETLTVTPADVRVSFAQASYSVREGESVEMTLNLSLPVLGQVFIPVVALSADTTATADDYSGIPTDVLFDDGQTTATLTFTAAVDDAESPDETVQVGFGRLPSGIGTLPSGATDVTIMPSDVTVSFDQASYSAREGEGIEVTVSLSGSLQVLATVSVMALTAGTTADAGDYTIPQNVIFGSGETSRTFTFVATLDDAADADETVALGFSAVGLGTGAVATATVTITEEPLALVSFDQAAYTVREGEATRVTLNLSETFTTDAAGTRTVRIMAVAAGTTADASDYELISQDVVFAAGFMSQTFLVAAEIDGAIEGNETLQLGFDTLSPLLAAGTLTISTVTITEDPPIEVSFDQASYSVREGDGVAVTVRMGSAPGQGVRIPLVATTGAGTTAGADDYTFEGEVYFNADETMRTFVLDALTDAADADAGDETVQIGFGTLPGGIAAGTPADTTVTITDVPPDMVTEVEPGLIVSPESQTVYRGGQGSYTLRLGTRPTENVTVNVLAPQTRGAVTVSTTIAVFTPDNWNAEQTVTVDAPVDSSNSTVLHSFVSNDPVYSVLRTGGARINVHNVLIQFEAASRDVLEGESITVNVHTIGSRSSDWVVSLTPRDDSFTAETGDYSGIPQTLTIAAGRLAASFTVTAEQDADGDDETFAIDLGQLPLGVRLEGNSQVEITITDDDGTPGLTLSVDPDYLLDPSTLVPEMAVGAGAEGEYAVALNSAPSENVTVTITGPDAMDDISIWPSASGGLTATLTISLTATLTFTPIDWSVAQMVTVGVKGTADAGTVNSGARLTHAASSGDSAYSGLSARLDVVPRFVEVDFEMASYDLDEGESVEVLVHLSEPLAADTMVPLYPSPYNIATDDQPGGLGESESTAEEGDYSGVPEALLFPAGETTASFVLTAEQDGDNQDEAFEISLLGIAFDVPGLREGADTPDMRVTIADDETPGLFVSPMASTVSTGGRNIYTVRPITQPGADVFVTITASTGDVSVDPSILDFTRSNPCGETETNCLNTSWDAERTVTVLVNAPITDPFTLTHATVSADSDYDALTVVVTVEVEPATISFAQATEMVSEGGSVVVAVRLNTGLTTDVTVPLTVSGTATSTDDYSGVPQALTIAEGETEASFTISAVTDLVIDEDETIRIGFGTLPSIISPRTPVRTTVTIEETPPVLISFERETYDVSEDGAVEVTVRLSQPPMSLVTVPVMVVAAGTDATMDDYSGVPQEVHFNAGETTTSFEVAALLDDDDDAGETIQIGFGALPSGINPGTPITTTVTTAEAPLVQVSFSTATINVEEGGSIPVTVRLSSSRRSQVTIPLMVVAAGTSATSDDYANVPENVVFNPGDTLVTFPLEIAGDEVPDANETVQLGFGELPTGFIAGTPGSIVVTILEEPPVLVFFDRETDNVEEGGSVTVTVRLGATRATAATVPLTVSGTAASTDYSGVPQDVTFAPGQTTATFQVMALSDADDDPGETVRIGFGALPFGLNAGTPDSMTVTLLEEPPALVSFERVTDNVEEGADITVTVLLSESRESAVTVPLTVSGTAMPADYSGIPADVTFQAGETTTSFQVTASPDADTDTGETIEIGFGTLPFGISTGTPDTKTVTILDAPLVEVLFDRPADNVVEGRSVTVMVRLGESRASDVTIPVMVVAAGTTASTNDYSGIPQSVEFDAGQTAAAFTLTAERDEIVEEGETVQIGFGALPFGIRAVVTASSITVTILDTPAITVSDVNEDLLPRVTQAMVGSTLAVITERMHAADVASGSAGSSLRSSVERTLAGLPHMLEREADLKQALDGKSFVLPLNEDGSGPGQVSLWGQGDYRDMEGGDDREILWDGDVWGLHAGMDMTMSSNMRAGVAVSWSEGDFDYERREDARAGTYDSEMFSVHPYASWTISDSSVRLWLTAGYGRGEIDIQDDGDVENSSDTRLQTVAAGASGELFSAGDMTMRVKLDGHLSEVEADGGDAIQPMTADIERVRLSLEGMYENSLDEHRTLSPTFEIGLRHDGGDGLDGTALEAGAGLRYANPAAGLRVEGQGRYLVSHSDDYDEWGLRGEIRIDPGADRRGLAFSLLPTWGAHRSGLERLWMQNAEDALSLDHDGPRQGRVDVNVEYGLPAAGRRGLVTPYARVMLGSEARNYRLGARYEIGPLFSVSLEGGYLPDAVGRSSGGVGIQTELRF